jgi:putative transposase
MDKSTEFYTGRHVIFQLYAHLVFITKYRKEAITERVFLILKEAFESVCKDFEGELLESNYEEDHVHLLVSYPPKTSVSKLVNSLKGVSARLLRAKKLPEVAKKLWGKHFWSPSYCVVSCGGAPLEVLKRYIQSQRGSHDTNGASSPP